MGQWSATFPGAAKVLATSPGARRLQLAPWCKELPARCAASFRSGSAPHPAAQAWHPRACGPTCRNTRKWRNSGFHPTSLPGVKRVSAKDVVELQGQGAVVVDTRTEKEYRAKRIRGAVWAAYGEKSLKDVAFSPRAGRLQGPGNAGPQQGPDLLLQRGGMLEVLQGREGGCRQRLSQRLLDARRPARVGRRGPATEGAEAGRQLVWRLTKLFWRRCCVLSYLLVLPDDTAPSQNRFAEFC